MAKTKAWIASNGRWRSRIVGHGEAAPSDLQSNAANWRSHPLSQRAALAGVLDEVGWVQDVIVNRRTGNLVDGHLRLDLALERKEPSIPVVYVDVSEDEERKLLVTLDPLAGMATADPAALDALLTSVQTESEAVQALLAKLGEDSGVRPPNFEPVGIEDQSRLDQKASVTCPECGCEFTP